MTGPSRRRTVGPPGRIGVLALLAPGLVGLVGCFGPAAVRQARDR